MSFAIANQLYLFISKAKVCLFIIRGNPILDKIPGMKYRNRITVVRGLVAPSRQVGSCHFVYDFQGNRGVLEK